MLNKKFIKNLGGVIITGESHNEVFQDFVSRNNLYIVPNFAQDYIFTNNYFTYDKKFGIRDYRGGGRSSARETANWVVAGALAKQLISTISINGKR